MIEIEKNKDLAPLNTFGISARAAGYAEFRTKEDLEFLFSHPEWKGRPWYVINGGSNVLLRGDYEGLILHPADDSLEETGRDAERVRLRAGAGLNWDEFVAFCIRKGYGGVENLAGIPGNVGSSPIQNIGAYGVEAKDTIESVEVYLTGSGEVVRLSNEQCRFGYRDSIFKREMKGGFIVLSVTFRLALRPEFRLAYGDLAAEVERLGGASLGNIGRAVISIRNSKLPDPKVLGNSGSFFKNPVVGKAFAAELAAANPGMPVYPAGEDSVKLAAGWLIDRCGLKGFRDGNAGVHDRQALVLVNHGGATGAEIWTLAEKVIGTVYETFGVRLEPEVNLL